MTQDLIDNYEYRCNLVSDINEHLPTLKKYAEDCDHVTEMGVRWLVSTIAFMMGKPKKLISYDIDPLENWGINTNEVVELGKKNEIDFNFILGNTLELEIEETDLLFLDTWHSYKQLKAELALHASKVKKYIIFHDTTEYADKDETSYEEWGDEWKGEGIGIWKAIEEFLESNPKWELIERFTNCNGLTIIGKK